MHQPVESFIIFIYSNFKNDDKNIVLIPAGILQLCLCAACKYKHAQANRMKWNVLQHVFVIIIVQKTKIIVS